MAGSVKVGGAWKTVSGASVKVGGAWKTVSAGYTKVGGAWKQWYSSGSYFFGTHDDPANSYVNRGRGIGVDSSGNIYWGTGINDIARIHKIDANGNLVAQRKFVNSWISLNHPMGMSLDASNNLYFGSIGSQSSSLTSYKFDSNLNTVWKKAATISSSYDAMTQVATDENVGLTSSYSSYHYFNLRNSAGTTIRSRYYQIVANNDTKTGGLAAGPSGTFFQCGTSWVGSSPYPNIWKWNTDGSIAWHRRANSGGGAGFTNKTITSDSSGNVYLVSRSTYESNDGNTTTSYLSKFDTNGNSAWSVGMNGSMLAKGLNATGVAVDSAGDVYVLCQQYAVSGANALALLKFNSSGALQWQRDIIVGTENQQKAVSVTVDASAVYISGGAGINNNNLAVFAKLPKDGTKTGTYSVGGISITYAASSYSIVGGISWTTGSGASGSAGISDDAELTTISATSDPISKVVI